MKNNKDLKIYINGIPRISNMNEVDKQMFFQSYTLIQQIKKWKVDKELNV